MHAYRERERERERERGGGGESRDTAEHKFTIYPKHKQKMLTDSSSKFYPNSDEHVLNFLRLKNMSSQFVRRPPRYPIVSRLNRDFRATEDQWD